MTNKEAIARGEAWFDSKEWSPFPFQQAAWEAYLAGESGLVNAPTGSGKTYSLFLPIAMEYLKEEKKAEGEPIGLRAIWITPIRALTKEIQAAAQRAVEGLGLDWDIAIRSGDTSSSERSRQKRKPPQLLITTPESLHLLLARPGYPEYFAQLKSIIIDEWHELVGSKRGVQVELALSRLKGMLPSLKVWGISATIGNMEEALATLLGSSYQEGQHRMIRSDIKKAIEVISVLPESIERFPWAGHLGIKLLPRILPIIEESQSSLIFTNTRAQCEIWYQQLLEAAPELIGLVAMHHGSISRELRDWVEQSLHEGKLKAVVCTSSLDLGVDFRPVETIIQIGSPKGVSRFVQRAGRSGHRPGALSRIYFVPTHSLELVEAAALRKAIAIGRLEHRLPYIRSFDVLIQYLLTLAVSEGFMEQEIYEEIKTTYAFASITPEEWAWVLAFLTTGGSLDSYDEYRKVGIDSQGRFRIMNQYLAKRHRLSIGTIVGESNLKVKYVRGKQIGTVEEWFINQLKPGDVFWFAGRSLKLVRVKDMTVEVRLSKRKTAKVPAWLGGRLPLSSQMSEMLREKVDEAARQQLSDTELSALEPLLALQQRRSHLPQHSELLIEYFQDREGYHLLFYPFEGRYVHEGMSALLAGRLSRQQPISFSIAMNDYGFELLSDTELELDETRLRQLFAIHDLSLDIQHSVDSTELARRRFRDIASISGLIFKGYPGNHKKDKHLQSSSSLLFNVFNDYEPENLLFLQAYDEVRTFQLEEARLREALRRIANQKIVLTRPDRATPFAFPIMVDRLRERMSSEKLEDRIRKMRLLLERE
ncbi:MAG: ligase-associated DNA damage response DEXH box helicase [Bacteroidota bacterium]